MVRAVLAGAVLALAAVGSARAAENHEWDAPPTGQIFLPTTPNDFGGMIFSLLEQQVKFLAAKDGVETEGSPANLVASMAHYLMEAQQVFFKEAAPVTTAADGSVSFTNIVANHNITFPFPNQTFPAYPNFTAPAFLKTLPEPPSANATTINNYFTQFTKQVGISNRTDPITQDLFNLITQDPAGPELVGAFQALPNFPDPVSLGTANFSGGNYNTGVNGTRTFSTIGSTLFNYRPCFFQGNQAGANIAPTLIAVTPRIAQVQPYGLEVSPKLIEVAPRILTVKPIGVNVQPLDIQVSPVLINISPKVNFYHPYVPGVPGSGK